MLQKQVFTPQEKKTPISKEEILKKHVPPPAVGGEEAAAPSAFLKVTEPITVTACTGTATESAAEALGRTTTALAISPSLEQELFFFRH